MKTILKNGIIEYRNAEGQLHREDGPAVEYVDGDKVWYLNGQLHREDGPAIEHADGYKVWYLNDKRHREDGPAIEHADGYKEWWLNNKRHREDGPAIELANGIKHWFINGVEYSAEDFNKNKILYIDMDNVLVDFQSGIDKLSEVDKLEYKGRYDEHPEIFSLMEPMKDAIESYEILEKHYDVYILSTSPWENPPALMQKLEWVKKYLPTAYKNVIFSHHKNLNKGAFLIDDRTKNGAGEFEGTHIHFGNKPEYTWKPIVELLTNGK